MMGAVNQQERLDVRWFVGFVDGEGCFHVALNKLPKMALGWQVLPEFRVVQHQRDEKILYKIKNYFGFGDIYINHGDRKEFRVRGLENLNKKQHLNKKGLKRIANLASKMNRQVKRHLESPETIRRTQK